MEILRLLHPLQRQGEGEDVGVGAVEFGVCQALRTALMEANVVCLKLQLFPRACHPPVHRPCALHRPMLWLRPFRAQGYHPVVSALHR